MNLYEEFYPFIVEMLEEFGAPAELVRSSPATRTYDPVTNRSVATAATDVSTVVQTAVGPWTWEDDEGREVTRTTAPMWEKPLTGDRLLQGEMAYTIGRVTTVAPQGKPIVYMAEVS